MAAASAPPVLRLMEEERPVRNLTYQFKRPTSECLKDDGSSKLIKGDMSTAQQETDQWSKHQRAVVQLASTSTKSR
jgi:hypothetical protein